jgi:hypothetical protein
MDWLDRGIVGAASREPALISDLLSNDPADDSDQPSNRKADAEQERTTNPAISTARYAPRRVFSSAPLMESSGRRFIA